ncbi:MAG: hypothetical protein IKB07_05375 [Lachnospiraceae bacterium]|nr:hypothetical protein [Lachnospiraceae bacterium]
MTGVEMVMGVLLGLVGLLGVVALITLFITKLNAQKVNEIKNIYLCKMVNTDSSIQDAIRYIKLTNGVNVKEKGENE